MFVVDIYGGLPALKTFTVKEKSIYRKNQSYNVTNIRNVNTKEFKSSFGYPKELFLKTMPVNWKNQEINKAKNIL